MKREKSVGTTVKAMLWVQDGLQEHGGNPIESLLDGKSALDAIMGAA